MTVTRVSILALLLLSAVIASAHGQSDAKPPTPRVTLPTPSAERTAEPTYEVSDLLGRNTPHGTLSGFLQAAEKGKYKEAAQYLQLSKMERAANGEHLARELYVLMDQALVNRVGAISDNPEGSLQSGVPQDRERIGVVRINGNEADVDLVRVSDPAAGNIWLFSSSTLTDVPALFSQLEENQVESKVPRSLVAERVRGTPLWRWIAFLLLIPVALGLSWAIVGLLRAGLRIWLCRRRHPMLQDFYDSLSQPASLTLTILIHGTGVVFLGLPLRFRERYWQVAGITLVVSLAWLVFRLINKWAMRARISALAGSGYRSASIILLGQRILNVVVVIVAVLVTLTILGFNMTTALAGLGIGSIAIAFAAQKTLENLLGGISILTDEVIRVGETCRIDNKVGTVQDISLRSTRIRTVDSEELSVPNGKLANMNIENLSRYDRNSLRETIRLQYGTSPEQLQSLLAKMRALLHEHPKVDPDGARVRFVGFGESSLNVEIYCHVLTGVWSEFLAIREDIFFQMMDLFADAGTGLALPARALYMSRDQRGEKRVPGPEENVFERRPRSSG